MPPPPCRRGDRATAARVLLLVVLTGFLSCAAAARPALVVHGGGAAALHSWHRSRVMVHDNRAVVSRFTFDADGNKPPWSQRPSPIVVTYAFSPDATINYPPPAEVRAAFQRAFARWARVIPVSFVETDDYDGADIEVGFYTGDHDDGYPFGGPHGDLAHASAEDGDIHLDASRRWAVLSFNSRGTIDMESVVTHEIGHVLGLDHSTTPDAVMNPNVGTRKKKKAAELTLDDVQGAQQLYGANPNFNISSLYDHPPDNSMSTPATSSCCFARVVVAGIVTLVMLATIRF